MSLFQVNIALRKEGLMPYSYRITSRVLYSGQCHRHHCTLHAFLNHSRIKWAIGTASLFQAQTKLFGFLLMLHQILWNSMTSTSRVFTELANAMKYGGGFLYNLIFTEWRHCVSQNEVWGEGVLYNLVFTEWRHCVSQNIYKHDK